MLGFPRSSSWFPIHISDFCREMDDIFSSKAALRHFNVDMEDKEDYVLVAADLPGIEPSDITVAVENGVLTISGQRTAEKEQNGDNFYLCERCCGNFSRSFRVPADIDDENIKAELRNGVLNLTLPKKERAKLRKVEIKAACR